MFVRTAGARDLEAISHLLAEVCHAAYDAIHGATKVGEIVAARYAPSALHALLNRPNSEFLAADDGAAICGAAYAEVSGDVATLRLLHVRPTMQGRGVGGLMLDEMEGCFPQANRVRLEIDEANAKAVAFCVGQGFIRIGMTEGDGSQDAQVATVAYERPIHWAE